jgi:hypothetical protein
MLSRVTHVLPLTLVRRQRLLPTAGRVLVRAGQKVAANDVIAEAKVEPGHLLLDIARGLGLPPEKADTYISRKVGAQVAEGDVLAGPVSGILSRAVHAPKDGVVAATGNGRVLLALPGKSFELRAGIPGMVVELISERGAVVENYGALVQGVWGNNRMESGLMMVAVSSPTEEFTPNRLDVSMRGAIVLGGPCSNAEALRSASEIPVRGLVLASLTPELVSMAAKQPFPIMVLEGFGRLPFDTRIYKALSTNDKREVCLNASPRDRFGDACPELFIPLPAINVIPEPRDTDIFAPGQIVRVTQAPQKNQIAVIDSLLPGLTNFPNGLRAPAASIHLENGDKVACPLVNLEIIE